MRKTSFLSLAATLLLAGCAPSAASTEVTFYTDEGSIPVITTADETTVPGSEETTGGTTEAATTTQADTTADETTPEATTAEETTIEETTTEATTEAPTESSTLPPTDSYDFLKDVSPVVMVTTGRVNMRTAPNTGSEVAAILEPGTSVTVIAKGDGWTRIDVGGTFYYVSADYLKEASAPEAETTVAPSAVTPTVAPTTPPSPTQPVIGDLVRTTVEWGGIKYVQGNGPLICIDPGHMWHGDSTPEPNAPGSSVMKARVTSGTAGCVTGKAESIVNLEVSLQLRDVLLAKGYNVLMTREVQEVELSNMERALIANGQKADAFIRVHCNSVTNPDITGICCFCPSSANPYVGGIYPACYSLSTAVLQGCLATTGAKDMGVALSDTMSGINWSQVPVTIIEMGFMSNPTEDRLLCDPAYQAKLVQGMAAGMDAYFGK